MSHIIGRPNDDVLAVMLGVGADPEQAFISDSEQGGKALPVNGREEDVARAEQGTVEPTSARPPG